MNENFEIKRQGNKPVIHFKLGLVSGSAKYPDPRGAYLIIKNAGYLISLGRDDAVISRPTGTPNWVKCEPDSLRGAVDALKEPSQVAALLNAAIIAAEMEAETIKIELAVARDFASMPVMPAGGIDLKVESAVKILQSLTVEQRTEVFKRFE